ncbi:MAG TPA: FG-GAP-like repeat-containing protein [Candidatus Sabulitectum sp.]|nr:FG-GAP-like repeat-containing protein [Candidatus Sabulitectum sp.]
MKHMVSALIVSAASSAQIFQDAAVICPLDVAVKEILCCDLDGNEYQDILLRPYPSGNLRVIMNDGSGFSGPWEIPWTGYNPRAADIDGDGLDDILTGLAGPVLFSNGDGTFTPSACQVLGCAVPGDFNGDGMPDLLMGSGRYFCLAVNNGWGESFETVWSDSIPFWPGVHVTGFFAGDMAGDAFMDFAVLFSYGLRVYAAQGAWDSYLMVEAEDDLYTYLSGSPPYAQCDINNDGHPDLLNSAWDIYPSPPPPINISMWVDDPGAWYWPLTVIYADYLPTVGGCDFNGDGFDDVFYSSSYEITVLSGTLSGPGDPLFSDAQYFSDAAGFGFISGSANPDLLSANTEYLYLYQNALTSVGEGCNTRVSPSLSISSNPFSGVLSASSDRPGTFRLMDLSGRVLASSSGASLDFVPEGFPGGSLLLEFTGGGSRVCEKLLYLP